MIARVTALVLTIAHWFYGLRPAAGSIQNYLNPVELLRVVIPALLHGGGIYAILTAVLGSASAIFAAPYVSISVAVLTAFVQVARLFDHGPQPPVPARSA